MMPRLIRFLLSGGSAAAVEYLVFLGMQTAFGNRWLLVSQSTSFACGFVVSFLLNRRWVFRSENTWTTELARYGALAAVNLVLGNFAMVMLVDHVHVHVLLAKFMVMGMIAAWNYLLFSRLVFRPSSGPR
jgi:putative flippase GtrA